MGAHERDISYGLGKFQKPELVEQALTLTASKKKFQASHGLSLFKTRMRIATQAIGARAT